ncbi:MAG TPA: protein-L-isoaspartate(D-aspartate) O-methyltransferase [Clostridiaceae bacterium]|nr:protein-L-isoaspartate(D-aspartate) O-methyltransferase [Clostridiaceae bacterium]
MDFEALKRYYAELDRSLFLDGPEKALAGRDSPLPIGFGQTISQPSLVLEMTRLLAPEPDSRVLEVGTGSGYQTALLARFSDQVYTLERIPELSRKAEDRLTELGFTNIHYKIGDGSLGWPQEGPFDRIMVTAAAGRKPEQLLAQLALGGRIVIPVGPRYMQDLLVLSKDDKGRIMERKLGAVRFVEMVGPYGWGGEK